ncbi:MAG: phosphotransferase [Spirochaetaceae bacterium]|nr:phosphotransferase [Spirochaetaceae bacterium]
MTGHSLTCRDADGITVDWMRRALRAGGVSDPSEVKEVVVENLGAATNAFGSLLRCHLVAQDGSPAVPRSVIVKFPTDSALAMRFAKWLAIHQREYDFYRQVAAHAPIRSPAFLYGEFDEDSHRFVLVLEDLRPMEATPQAVGVNAERARIAVRELANLHGMFWEAVDRPPVAGSYDCLSPRYGRRMQSAYLLCLPLVLERFSDHFSTGTGRLVEAFGTRIGAHFANVATGPVTFIHGDYRGENLLFDPGDAAKPAVVDWQGCGFGSGLYDVAYFLGTSVSVDDRRRIERQVVQEYHDIVCRHGAKSLSLDDCWRSYRQNMLSSVVPCILGCGGMEMADPRMLDLAKVGLHRILTAVEDLDAGEFLPTSMGSHFSRLSLCGYQAYKLVHRLRRNKNHPPVAPGARQ